MGPGAGFAAVRRLTCGRYRWNPRLVPEGVDQVDPAIGEPPCPILSPPCPRNLGVGIGECPASCEHRVMTVPSLKSLEALVESHGRLSNSGWVVICARYALLLSVCRHLVTKVSSASSVAAPIIVFRFVALLLWYSRHTSAQGEASLGVMPSKRPTSSAELCCWRPRHAWLPWRTKFIYVAGLPRLQWQIEEGVVTRVKRANGEPLQVEQV